MVTSDLLLGALLGCCAVVVVGGVAVALTVQVRAKRTALQAQEIAEKAARDAVQDKATAVEQAQAARSQAHANWQWYEAGQAEGARLVERLQAVADIEARGYTGVDVPGLLHPYFAGTPLDKHHQAAEDLLREAVEITRAGVGSAARAGVRGVTDEAQMFLTRLQLKIDEELREFPQASVYHQSLVDIDHLATQALHSVQRLRLLAGSWPGIQRADCTFREIIESARGRIGPYNRVEYTYLPEVGETWVEGRVVEPITVALAELMANATSYSDDLVSVYVQQMQAGCRIVVEDTGLGMNPFQLAEAERLLSQRTALDAAALKDERKLGFALIGRLAHDYGFRVDVSAPSTSGGVKAVCLIPLALICQGPREQARPEPAGEGRPEP
ncbi:HAMP domain-containing histidine kinase, partial [Nonomuraea deserti]